MVAPETESTFAGFDDDYQVIRLRLGWGVMSIVAFTAILTIQLFGRWLGVSLFQLIAGTAGLAVAGFVLGLIGMRFDRSHGGRARGSARVGVFLNGAVIGIFLLVPVVIVIMRRLG